MDSFEELRRLREENRKGVLSDEAFERAREVLLESGMGPGGPGEGDSFLAGLRERLGGRVVGMIVALTAIAVSLAALAFLLALVTPG